MGKASCVRFEPFRLDLLDERLWQGDVAIPLGQKGFGVLAHLVGHANRLVTKDDLLASVWPDTAVSEAVLTTAVRELRRALGDSSRAPRFIQTVYGRGYRFIAPVVEAIDSAISTSARERGGLVGRDAEMGQLRGWFDAALQSRRRVGFVAGEAGIGKTSLVEGFVADVVATAVVWVGRGQCIEQYGAGEAYLPILEALERLGHERDVPLAQTFQRHAPSWLGHLPRLAMQGVETSAGVRPERMLRELTLAVEALTMKRPLVLIIEDLHWSDSATLAWLASVARRREAARLLIVATYRPVEALMEPTPLRNVLAELRHHPQSGEVVLDGLSRDAVREFVRREPHPTVELEPLVDVLHRRTGGHPLFLAGIIDEIVEQMRAPRAGQTDVDLAEMAHTMPVHVSQFIEHRFELLSDQDQRILEAGSVAGDSFSVAAVEAATAMAEERIEARCAVLTRAHRLLVSDGVATWPDGTLAARYKFRHALFHEAAYTRISPERRARLHLLIGNRLEAAYGQRGASIASELGVHFEQGRDAGKAVSYLEQSALNALSRSAYAEAHRHLAHGLEMTAYLPEGRDRLQREATLSLLRAHVLETTRGWSDREVEQCFARARTLGVALADEPRLLQSTWGLIAVNIVRGDLLKTRALSRDMLALAKKGRNNLFRMAAHVELGGTALMLARARTARRHFDLAGALSGLGPNRSTIATFGMDLAIFGRIWTTHLMWYEGDAEQARAVAADVLAEAEATDHAFTQTVTLAYAAMLSQFRRDFNELDRLCATTIEHAAEHGFPYYLAWARVLRGWSLVMQGAGDGAVADMRRHLEMLQSIAGLRLPYYRALFAEACGQIGRVNEGLRAIGRAFDDARTMGEQWWAPELHRTRGELLSLVADDSDGEAEQCVRTAIDVACRQGAKALEARAIASLSRIVTAR